MTHLIDGKQISKEIKDELKLEVSRLKAEGKQVCLAVYRLGRIRLHRFMSTIKRKPVHISGLNQNLMNWKNRRRRKSFWN